MPSLTNGLSSKASSQQLESPITLIVYVDMPEVGDEVEAGEVFGAVESVKAASDLICPVSGEVVEINEALEDAPETINAAAFDTWIIKVKVSDPSEIEKLLDAEGYTKLCENE